MNLRRNIQSLVLHRNIFWTLSLSPIELKKDETEVDWVRDINKAFGYSSESHNYNKQLFDKSRKHISLNADDMEYIKKGNKLNRKEL